MKLKKMKLKEEVFFSSEREIRGGSCWYDRSGCVETASRKGVKPSDATHYLGFRPFRGLK